MVQSLKSVTGSTERAETDIFFPLRCRKCLTAPLTQIYRYDSSALPSPLIAAKVRHVCANIRSLDLTARSPRRPYTPARSSPRLMLLVSAFIDAYDAGGLAYFHTLAVHCSVGHPPNEANTATYAPQLVLNHALSSTGRLLSYFDALWL